MFALPIFMPRHVLKSIIFYENSPKLSYFCEKKQNFRALGASPPEPRASGGWGLCPQTPNIAPLIANFWLRACLHLKNTLQFPAKTFFFGVHSISATELRNLY